ncbi:hypothetical protein SteCoe_3503 [Stentor coeruleus]|uniref:ODAD1 central coiled coil region domain-containing protein n=1 Tax=Stentor coeruleus TaxID=5963 RepID=A0A1R2CX04_9CILI|nr:hypothetical protein SteCoe_3503 [Stentor coeruleus]
MYGIRRSITPGLSRRHDSKPNSQSFDDQQIDVNDKDDETQEIAAYLNLIRKRHDKIKQENLKKKVILERLKKDYEKALFMSQDSEENSSVIESKIQTTKESLEITKKQHKQEISDYRSCLYMLDRMKKDKIAMEIKANTIQSSLKSTRFVLNTEVKKSQQSKEANFQSKMMLMDIKKTYSQSKRKKDEYVINLEKELKSREDVAARREDRQKRQMEIAEAAANDDKDSPEVKLREKLLLCKMWLNFLSKKLTSEMKKAIDVERAFSKIKSATGLSDVNEIVEKFLTREQNYFMLLQAVSDAEKKLNFLRKENKSAKDMLLSLQFEDPKEKETLMVINILEKKVVQNHKNYENVKDKLKSTIKLYDQLLNWTQKMMATMNIPNNLDLHSGSKAYEAKNNLPDVFNVIQLNLGQLAETVKSSPEEAKQAFENFNAFNQMKTEEIVEKMSTEDALSKIIRVRMGNLAIEDDDAVFENREVKSRGNKN